MTKLTGSEKALIYKKYGNSNKTRKYIEMLESQMKQNHKKTRIKIKKKSKNQLFKEAFKKLKTKNIKR